MQYICYKNFNNTSISGNINIPIGSILTCENRILIYNEKQVCINTSENAHKYFMRNDDGQGLLRGQLIDNITHTLQENKDKWDIIENDPICQAYRRPEYEDHWLWNHAFYNTSIETLTYISNLIEGDTK